ncbi:MAG: 23S rRNA pseudouridine(2604) synthase RluF [Luteibaculaceae bacterium]
MENSPVEGIRINKFLSEQGYCSRREADRLIEAGKVSINNAIAELGSKVLPTDLVRVNGKNIKPEAVDRVYIALHKPPGIVCTTDTKREKDNIVDFINYPVRIFPIGRLDKYSEGLILLTNDVDIVNKILRSVNNHEKEYVVRLNAPITGDFIQRMSSGVPILDTITKPCKVYQEDERTFRIILTQGLNRQIRRMCEALGYHVSALKRVRIMNIKLSTERGEWRYLTDAELQELEQLTADSHKTFQG